MIAKRRSAGGLRLSPAIDRARRKLVYAAVPPSVKEAQAVVLFRAAPDRRALHPGLAAQGADPRRGAP